MALRILLEMRAMPDLLELLAVVPLGAAIYIAAIWLLSPELFSMAFRTATAVISPLRDKPVMVSKGG